MVLSNGNACVCRLYNDDDAKKHLFESISIKSSIVYLKKLENRRSIDTWTLGGCGQSETTLSFGHHYSLIRSKSERARIQINFF